MLRWLVGDPVSVMCSTVRTPRLELAVEDTADMIFRYADRLQAAVHVSFARRAVARGASISGEAGTCRLDWERGKVIRQTGKETQTISALPEDYDLNSTYIEMLKDAVADFSRSPSEAAVPLQDGLASLTMATAALRSNETRREVFLSEVCQ